MGVPDDDPIVIVRSEVVKYRIAMEICKCLHLSKTGSQARVETPGGTESRLSRSLLSACVISDACAPQHTASSAIEVDQTIREAS